MEDELDMNGDAPPPTRGLTEAEDIQMQSNQITDEEKRVANVIPILLEVSKESQKSLESTRRMLAMCEESKDAGIRTLVMLDEQGDSMYQVEEKVDRTNMHLMEAEKHIEDMEKCCGLINLNALKDKILGKNFEKGSEYANTWNKDDDGKVNTDGPRVMVGDQGGFQGQMITRITKDAREDDMEHNVSEVSGMITNLRNMAVDMGSEIEGQNRQIDRINQKGTSNEERIREANKRANILLASD